MSRTKRRLPYYVLEWIAYSILDALEVRPWGALRSSIPSYAAKGLVNLYGHLKSHHFSTGKYNVSFLSELRTWESQGCGLVSQVGEREKARLQHERKRAKRRAERKVIKEGLEEYYAQQEDTQDGWEIPREQERSAIEQAIKEIDDDINNLMGEEELKKAA